MNKAQRVEAARHRSLRRKHGAKEGDRRFSADQHKPAKKKSKKKTGSKK